MALASATCTYRFLGSHPYLAGPCGRQNDVGTIALDGRHPLGARTGHRGALPAVAATARRLERLSVGAGRAAASPKQIRGSVSDGEPGMQHDSTTLPLRSHAVRVRGFKNWTSFSDMTLVTCRCRPRFGRPSPQSRSCRRRRRWRSLTTLRFSEDQRARDRSEGSQSIMITRQTSKDELFWGFVLRSDRAPPDTRRAQPCLCVRVCSWESAGGCVYACLGV